MKILLIYYSITAVVPYLLLHIKSLLYFVFIDDVLIFIYLFILYIFIISIHIYIVTMPKKCVLLLMKFEFGQLLKKTQICCIISVSNVDYAIWM